MSKNENKDAIILAVQREHLPEYLTALMYHRDNIIMLIEMRETFNVLKTLNERVACVVTETGQGLMGSKLIDILRGKVKPGNDYDFSQHYKETPIVLVHNTSRIKRAYISDPNIKVLRKLDLQTKYDKRRLANIVEEYLI